MELMATDDEEDERGVGEVMRIVAIRVAETRRRAGLSRTDLAERAGMAVPRIHSLEHGLGNVTLRTLVRISRVLKVEPTYFFRTSDPVSQLAEVIERWERQVKQSVQDDLKVLGEIIQTKKDIENLIEETKKFIGDKNEENDINQEK
jgi:transcriptional regulator with XRE-family HTH domain